MPQFDKAKKVFAELLDSQLKRKADMAVTFDRSIAQLNALQGAMNELDEQIANTRSAYDSYILLPDEDENQLSTVDGTPVATEEETQQIAEGLNRLNNPDKLKRHLAPVPPYAGKTAEVWKPKKKVANNGDV